MYGQNTYISDFTDSNIREKLPILSYNNAHHPPILSRPTLGLPKSQHRERAKQAETRKRTDKHAGKEGFSAVNSCLGIVGI